MWRGSRVRHYALLARQLRFVRGVLAKGVPEHYDDVIGRWPESFRNWMSFHDRFAQDNLMRILPLRDYHIARMTAWGRSYQQIGERFHLAFGTAKNHMDNVFDMPLISGRDRKAGLAKFFI